ncbi:MAG: hypothetical protein A2600_09265 [Candidatus Lambdaproteobacteria bacterium RIFOXYD1_FULL_56_27]|uniref:D,D-heptose 1,7-bisphosphate phosphatase n=1 Tax=Candidatus Lambdaproteobacteria bacterium RIFOXYD2_FULL_56_26 TaxID=1817773 RepID=A0A1F6GPI4_9PROT|nr:MAG: hypothetical protein A2557_01370 [Candidatus Lambdaproteobacteria bacterium RIFOXYD2_FULL_56_26]OGH05202.1 MAG: hypothetical protein A2426_00140 [Candidatus Lambdaproteobacteria bacterium RIFOXYC1_FULL_56_13]OGH09829.1 MAG: hypothetical protein A2600_09265 [Candidatus Lambdaproteobacteria bacterium RIFOXYD1_FULL_56_27]
MSQKAIFFDRDGTLIEEVHYLNSLDQIRLLPGAVACIKALRGAGYFVGLVTNQSGVARGYFTEEFVRQSHLKINQLLEAEGTKLDGAAYCPHHPEGLAPYNLDCACRKPKPGMILSLAQDHHLNLKGSWVFGDRICDVELGLNAGLEAGLVLTGYGHKDKALVLSKYPKIPLLASLFDLPELILG